MAGRRGRSGALGAALVVALAVSAGIASFVAESGDAAGGSPGASGSGDPLFPHLGNGGYEVGHYDVKLSYLPGRRALRGRVTLSATATQDLSSFTLDMRRWLHPGAVALDGARVAARQRGAKLFVSPAAALPAGERFTLAIDYRGHPKAVGGAEGHRDGWLPTGDGAMVAAEPQGAPGWLPCNADLTDKATFSFSLTVPRPLKAVSNGRLLEVRRLGRKPVPRRRLYRWSESRPMAAYLATVAIGRFRLLSDRVGELPSIVALDQRLARRTPKGIQRTAGMLALFGSRFGPYPFDSIGAIVDAGSGDVALETQTRPIYDLPPHGGLHAHEIAHQWFGDAVGFARWSDIWLAEGFAQWSMWLWRDRMGVQKLGSSFRRSYSVPARLGFYWNPPPGRPGTPRKLFGLSTYERGAMTVEALRRELGNAGFYALLRAWIAQRLYGTGTIPDFTALAEHHAGRDLDAFFDLWLYRKGKPTRPLAHAPAGARSGVPQ